MAGIVSRVLLSVTVLAALGTGAVHADKVTICHIPPGNPGNAQTISVSENAVQAHLGHGDHVGECGCEGEPPEAACTDGEDNDCDGAVDEADSDCPSCGNQVIEPPEECDDGNENPFDGCDACVLVDINPG